MGQFIDKHIGNRICQRRISLGVSKACLGQSVGCNVLRFKRFELGLDRIPAFKLFELADALDVPVTYFFEGLKFSSNSQNSEDGAYVFEDPAIEVIASYYLVPRSKRKEVFRNAAAKGTSELDKLN